MIYIETRNVLELFLDDEKSILCIPTNGVTNSKGEAVMGAGIALAVKNMLPNTPILLGQQIKENGNIFQQISDRLFAFPTKNNWWDKSDIKLIEKSTLELKEYALQQPNQTFILPKPGCGVGQLKFEDVLPILKQLPDNVIVG